MAEESISAEEKESLARAHLPFRAEYCKTSRAKCKKCQLQMDANSLKLANLTKSRFHDGYDASYYHVKCFFQIKRPGSVAEIRHFETLKYEDQKMLEKAVETKGLSVLGTDAGELDHNGNGKPAKIGSKKAKKRGTEEVADGVLVNYEDFLVEYAKSNRAKCNLCEEKIDKDSIRLGKLDYEAETQWRGGPVPRWFHIECFVKSQQQLEFFGQVEKIKNFEDLEDEDQKMLKKKVKPMKPEKTSGDVDSKKIKTEDPGSSSEAKKEEELLKKQSDKYFCLRDFVNTMKRKDIEQMLEHMRQKSNFKAPSMLIDMATDVLLFGPLNQCPQCKNHASIVLRGSSYICTSGTEWESCNYESREPLRSVPDVPEEIVEKYPFFRDTYKFRIRKRIFPSKFIKAVAQKEAEDNNLVQEGAPLDGLTIGVISWKGVQTEKTKVQKKITTLGGKVQTALDKAIFAILSSKEELSKDSPKVEVAKALGVPFASADFLFKIETKDDVVPQLIKCLIGEWNGDLQERFTRLNVNQLKNNIKSRSAANVASRVYKSGSVAKSKTLVVKDGSAVDPDSGFDIVGRVYKRGPHIYSVVLNCVDVSKDKNSFYKLQIIEHETNKTCVLFRAWGRIGCDNGGTTLNEKDSADDAVDDFEKLFKERTGNEFSTIAQGTFKKKHGLYFPVELDYNDSKKKVQEEQDLKCSSESKLDTAVQELICFIFDVQRMQRAMLQFELDAEKMPLGKLSQKHISEAMLTLKELETALEVKPPRKPLKRQLVTLTNKFYSHIPQSFGDGQVQLIDSFKQIEEKNLMLAGLSEIEIAYNMCTEIDKTSDQLPVDQHYIQLKCEVSVLGQEDTEFQLISEYIKQTHALTHSNYSLVVKDIFKVKREEDVIRFKEHKMKERALLWHGSRTTNFAGIMSKGLRIAPPEAPVTGYMFGKGIYFADMVSKAANYCMTDPSNNIGLLLLCEVAMGKAYELFKSEPELPQGLPEGYDSVKGVGKSTTNSKTHVKIEDDLLVPMGKQTANKGVKSQLLYNEYIVYQESQAMIRYIAKTKFNFKS